MNTTRTVEIEVCGQCGEDIRDQQYRKWHYFTCPQCLREFCKHMATHFTVRVEENAPRGWPISEDNHWQGTTTSQCNEYEFCADFCADCEARIETVLLAAGLTKEAVPQSRYQAVALDAQTAEA